MEKTMDIRVQERMPNTGKKLGTPDTQVLCFYHGGVAAVKTVRNVQGVDGELLCASVSPNVARRYGDVVSRFGMAKEARICTLSLMEWFAPNTTLERGELFTDYLRNQGFDAVIVLGSDQSYDFPAPTLFVLSPDAIHFESVVSPTELAILDDGRSFVMDPPGPHAREWSLWMQDFGQDAIAYGEQPDDENESDAPRM